MATLLQLQLLRRHLSNRLRHLSWQSSPSVAFRVEHSAPKVNTTVAPANAGNAIGSPSGPLLARPRDFPKGQRTYPLNRSAVLPFATSQTSNSKQKVEGFA
jgi:hypothetical protein